LVIVASSRFRSGRNAGFQGRNLGLQRRRLHDTIQRSGKNGELPCIGDRTFCDRDDFSGDLPPERGQFGRAGCRAVTPGYAKLAIEEPAELPQDFTLALSTRGNPTRRCHVVWTTDGEIGVRFERQAAS
jgi:hypothetical protein